MKTITRLPVAVKAERLSFDRARPPDGMGAATVERRLVAILAAKPGLARPVTSISRLLESARSSLGVGCGIRTLMSNRV